MYLQVGLQSDSGASIGAAVGLKPDLREREWDIPNPVSGCKLREPEGRVRWITHAEAQALIRAAERVKQAPYLADFIKLALHTGMRRCEMLGLEWQLRDYALRASELMRD
jgi:integrase